MVTSTGAPGNPAASLVTVALQVTFPAAASSRSHSVLHPLHNACGSRFLHPACHILSFL